MVGDANSPIARMDIVNPEECTYLEDSAGRKMSYTRQKSLSRAISYRQTLVKRNGELADSQYTDQYLDRETIVASLKKQQSKKQSSMEVNDSTMDALGRYSSCPQVQCMNGNTVSCIASVRFGHRSKALRVQVDGQAAQQGPGKLC